MSQVMASEGDEDEDDDAWISLDICVWNKHIGSMKTYHENFPSCVHQGIYDSEIEKKFLLKVVWLLSLVLEYFVCFYGSAFALLVN